MCAFWAGRGGWATWMMFNPEAAALINAADAFHNNKHLHLSCPFPYEVN